MNTDCHVEIPADKLRTAIKVAYALSRPQGLGFLHARDGDLDEASIDKILARGYGDCVASMDYVHGRACKFHVYQVDGRLFVAPRWYDHGDYHLEQLLEQLGVDAPADKMAAACAAQEVENENYRRERASSNV